MWVYVFKEIQDFRSILSLWVSWCRFTVNHYHRIDFIARVFDACCSFFARAFLFCMRFASFFFRFHLKFIVFTQVCFVDVFFSSASLPHFVAFFLLLLFFRIILAHIGNGINLKVFWFHRLKFIWLKIVRMRLCSYAFSSVLIAFAALSRVIFSLFLPFIFLLSQNKEPKKE